MPGANSLFAAKEMKLILAFVLLTPSLVEAFLDRHGEDAHGKRKDTLWLLFVAILLSACLWLISDVPPWKTIALLIGWRLLIFDPLVNWFLKRNSESHKHINIWTYIGTTSKIDRLVSKVNPWVRMVIRAFIFVAALVWFLV